MSKLTRVPVAALERSPAALYLSRLGAGSVPAMRSALELVAHRFLKVETTILETPWHELRHVHVQGLRQWMVAQKYTPAYCNKVLNAVRGVLKACRRLKLISVEDFSDAIDIGRVSGSREGSGRLITKAEMRKLFEAAARQAPPIAARDATLLALLCMGLRRAEVVGLRLDQFDGRIAHVIGKGNKERPVPLAPGAVSAIKAWLTVTFLTDLIASGVDLIIAQRLAGHAQVTTTQLYDLRGLEEMAAAVEKVDVPSVPVKKKGKKKRGKRR